MTQPPSLHHIHETLGKLVATTEAIQANQKQARLDTIRRDETQAAARQRIIDEVASLQAITDARLGALEAFQSDMARKMARLNGGVIVVGAVIVAPLVFIAKESWQHILRWVAGGS